MEVEGTRVLAQRFMSLEQNLYRGVVVVGDKVAGAALESISEEIL